jgi:outer membrane protein TolC
VDVAWEIDLAGGVRASRDAAQADAAAAAAGVDGARLLVASEVARPYFVLRGAAERLRIVQALAAAQRETATRVGSRRPEPAFLDLHVQHVLSATLCPITCRSKL